MGFIKYKTKRGNEYLYDSINNKIIYLDSCLNAVYNLYEQNRSINEIFNELKYPYDYDKIYDSYSLISNNTKCIKTLYIEKSKLPELKLSYSLFSKKIANIIGLTLNVTEQCNFRCRYCIFSDNYPDWPGYSKKSMPFEIAKAAIDYFIRLSSSRERTRKYGNLGIGFYGGEPLLELELIKKCVKYTNSKRIKDKVFYNITTNGSMLNSEVIKYLIENNFNIALSLDGPQAVHDKNRVSLNGKGTFNRVLENILLIREKNEIYFKENISFSVVLGKDCNILETYKFFLEYFPEIKSFFITSPLDTNNKYQNSLALNNKINRQYYGLYRLYMKSLMKQDTCSYFMKSYYESSISKLIKRKYIDKKNLLFNNLGSLPLCFPGGSKLFVSANGDFHICERVNRQYPIGNIREGISYNKVKKIMGDYYNQVTKRCITCDAFHLCGNCYATMNLNSSFNSKYECDRRIRQVSQILVIYTTALENNPDAFINKSILKLTSLNDWL